MMNARLLEGGTNGDNGRLRCWVEHGSQVIGWVEWAYRLKLWYPVDRDNDRPSPEVGYRDAYDAVGALFALLEGLPPEEFEGKLLERRREYPGQYTHRCVG